MVCTHVELSAMSEPKQQRQPQQGEGTDAGEKEKPTLLTKEEVAALDDEEFFKAYREGRVPRREDHWTEENFEEVHPQQQQSEIGRGTLCVCARVRCEVLCACVCARV